MYRVLLVDDEPNILSALRRSLAAIDVTKLDGEALHFETFTSPEAAIQRSDEQDFDLVISDYRMPSMNGVEFLSRVMEFQPRVPRVIISGNADRDAIIAAVNAVHLTRFLEKPWDDQHLRDAVVSILGQAPPRN
jgi:DNA-binding NtrC family response regulator